MLIGPHFADVFRISGRKHISSGQLWGAGSRRNPGLSKVLYFVLVLCAAAVTPSSSQTLTPLHSFNGSDGQNPYRMALVQGIDGNFYGTTEMGGIDNFGVVFKMTPDGTVQDGRRIVGTAEDLQTD